MPREVFYIIALLVAIVVWFVIFKRPIYEAMFVGFVVLIFITKSFDQFIPLIIGTSKNTLFYAIFAFLMLAYVFSKTGVVHDINDVIVALLGRFSGGAGYVALISSTFMAALSGSGPGNVAATGVFTIPPMIRTGYPRALAATVEMSASSLGPMIPPSGTILLAFGILETVHPGTYSLSNFWIAVWLVGIYFILQRLITLFILIRINKIEPMAKEEIPDLSYALKKGWKALMVPLIIFLPLLFDNLFNETFIASRIGEAGAKAFSSSVIQFTPGIAAIYAFLITRKDLEGGDSFSGILNLFKDALETVVPVSATIFFAYCISNLFGNLNVGESIGVLIQNLGLSRIGMVLFVTIFSAIMGMILPGSAQIAIFGVAISTSLMVVGVHPMVSAAILPALTGALEGMTPPLALSMYAAMGIANSDFGETSKYALIWVFAHMAVLIFILLGIFPVVGY